METWDSTLTFFTQLKLIIRQLFSVLGTNDGMPKRWPMDPIHHSPKFAPPPRLKPLVTPLPITFSQHHRIHVVKTHVICPLPYQDRYRMFIPGLFPESRRLQLTLLILGIAKYKNAYWSDPSWLNLTEIQCTINHLCVSLQQGFPAFLRSRTPRTPHTVNTVPLLPAQLYLI